MRLIIGEWITHLLDYSELNDLSEPGDRVFLFNRLLELLELGGGMKPGVRDPNGDDPPPLREILDGIGDFALDKGLLPDGGVTSRDGFEARVMGLLLPRPSELVRRFYSDYARSPSLATDNYYRFCRASDYIKTDRIRRDIKWACQTEYGEFEITINLSKPEKDPRAIAEEGRAVQSGYPKCLLCRECEGFAGAPGKPARQNHRLIPVKLNGEPWYLQYSPYVYYNEHCIVLSLEHTPMRTDRRTFSRLLEFTDKFPHYFIGANADLPVVGGSILSHDHFQGGNYFLPMARAAVEEPIEFAGFPDVSAGILRWPVSVIRLRGSESGRVAALANRIFEAWKSHSDSSAQIFAETGGEWHNAVTPIARRRDGDYELDLALRNNITTPEHPLGLFHPHEELHNIKKENIGLIEVMGLAILPARLKEETELLAERIIRGESLTSSPETAKHADFAAKYILTHRELNADNIRDIIRLEIGRAFARVLECAGVFKRDASGRGAFRRFIDAVNRNG